MVLFSYYTRIILELFRLKRKFIWYSIVRTNATDLTNEDFDKKNKYDINHLFIFLYIKSSGYYNFSLKNRHSSFVVNNSNACIPNSELPFLFNLGDHVATTKILGNKQYHRQYHFCR
jgi:hypothetical protein